MAHSSWVRQIEVRPAAGADLDVELELLVAVGALAFGFVLVDPVEDHGDQPERGQHRPDQEPDEERAALALADDAGGEAEEKGDDQVLHGTILALQTSGFGWPIEPTSERSRRNGRP